jgi:hypothetical protein
MSDLFLAIASPETLSRIGLILLLLGLLGEVGVLLIPTEKHLLHNLLGIWFAAVVLVGVMVGHIGDDAIIEALTKRATTAEKKLADRTLSNEQIASIGRQLVPFAGQRFTIHTYWTNPEPTNFAKRIGNDALIAAAHWTFVKPDGFLVGAVDAVTVNVASDSDEKTKGAGKALVSALKDANVDAMLGSDQADKTLIDITVGIKR